MQAQAQWRFGRGLDRRNALVLCETGNPLLDGIPLAFGGDPAGTALANLTEINSNRAALGLDAITIVNTHLSLPE